MALFTSRYEDDDAYHLPHGMKRVGYDEETGRYTFRQGDDLWLGEPGSFYGGKMKWAGKAVNAEYSSDGDLESEEDDCSTDSDSDSKKDDEVVERKADTHKAVRSFSYVPTSGNEWGVPTTSISASGARPPDTSMRRNATLLKKVVIASRIAVTGTRTSKKNTSADKDSGESLNQQVADRIESITEKELPPLPTN